MLRFSEFTDNWSIRNLGELVNIKTGKKNTQDKVSDGQYPFFVRSQQIEKIDTYSFDGEAILTAGDGVGVGKVFHYINGKFDYHQRVYCLSGFRDFVFGKYIYEVFKNNFGAETTKYSAKNSVDSVRLEMISGMKIPLPSLAEQQKIADCLSSLDKVISLQTQKIDAMQQYKKGLMQKLFPAEGETMPELRFPEFREEWESEPMGKIYSFKSNNSLSREKLNYVNGFVKNIHYGDIHTKYSSLFDITKEVVPFINPSESLDSFKEESYCIEGDMIFADASEDLQDIGKCIEILNLNNEKLLSGTHTILARQIRDRLIVGFGAHLFKSTKIRAQIQKEAQGTKVLGLSANRLSNIEILFPTNKIEQQKIADCLSSLDGLITDETQKLAALKTHKTGLMQQLFPSMDEVNA
ncbi:restriction endonuclease subunit S [Salmonella enterica]|nr:restriction endonuclease subunit S [Salmonella enterica]